jgi:glycosyltransferase involved in cell wall biosynthesis
MKVAIVWHCRYPWDVRIEKFCRSIASENNEVVIICRGDGERPAQEMVDGVKVHRVGMRGRLLGKSMARLLSAPVPFSPLWLWDYVRIMRRERPDVVVVRDLPLALFAGILGVYLNVPVVLDMAENYPAALLAYGKALYRPFLLANALLPRLYERLSLVFMERVIVVAEEQRDRLVRLRYPLSRIALVRNTPDPAALERAASAAARRRQPSSYILYSGFIDRHRGIRTLVLAFERIKDRFKETNLVLIGKGNELEALKSLAEEHGLGERVVFKGWVDAREIPAYIKNSAVCAIPHLKSEHTETTIPNKIFDYLFFGRQTVVSDAAPLARIIRQAGCGFVFRSGDPEDLSRALIKALHNRKRADCAARAQKLVRETYNWAGDSRILVAMLQECASQKLEEKTGVIGDPHVS